MKKNILSKNFLGNTGIAVSPVGFGALPIGPSQYKLAVDNAGELIYFAYKKGITFIDTAQYYKTYPHIRFALDRILMENPDATLPVICSKSLCTDYEGMTNAVDEALEAMNLPHIDIFLLHEVRTGMFEMRSEAWKALKKAKEIGKVKAIGISTHHADVVSKMSGIDDCDVIFPLINFRGMGIRYGDSAGTRLQMETAIKKCRKKGKGVFAMKVFGGGNLTGHYQEALDYICSNEDLDSFVIGFGSKFEILDIISYLDGTMLPTYAPDISHKRITVNQEDCEGCGTCIDICHSAAISFSKDNGLAVIDSSKCITCGYCAQGCPVRAIIMY